MPINYLYLLNIASPFLITIFSRLSAVRAVVPFKALAFVVLSILVVYFDDRKW